jgi:hypothetical protein
MRLDTKWLVLAASGLFIGCGGGAPPADEGSGGSGGGSASASSSAESSSAASSSASGGAVCKDAKQLIAPIDQVTTREVIDLSKTPDEKVVYVDASAGGPMGMFTNPWIYMSLSKAMRVDVTDVNEFSSSDWDLAMKRSAIRTNGGDSGPGKGGAVFLKERNFDEVTSAEALSATLATESWFSEPCKPIFDEAGRFVTTFTGWYDYNIMDHTLTPHPGTFIVRDAAGVIYKLAILDFYSTPDGGTEPLVLGRFRIRYVKVSP